MSTIRPLERGDLGAVADLLVTVFQHSQAKASADMAQYLGALLLDLPDRDPEIHSLVYEREPGHIAGFMGVFSQTMAMGERTWRAAIGNSLAVLPDAGDPTAGARLCRRFFQGPQDITISDRSNGTSVSLWRGMGGMVLPNYSLDWVRVLRPLEAASLSVRRKLRMIGPTVAAIRGLDALAGRYAGRRGNDRWAPPSLPQRPSGLSRADADTAELEAAIPALMAQTALHPVWSSAGLSCVLAHSAQKREFGPLVRQLVRNRMGAVEGAYLYYVAPNGLAQVLHVLANPALIGPVLDFLLVDAYERGAVAIGGRAQAQLLEPLMDRKASFTSPYRCVFGARDPAVLDAVRNEDAVLGGLVGEFWTRLNGDDLK